MAFTCKKKRFGFRFCALILFLMFVNGTKVLACDTEATSPTIPVESKSFFANMKRKVARALARTAPNTQIPEPPNGCDAVYLRNIKALSADVNETKKLAKAAVIIDIPKTGGKFGAVVLLKKVGLISAESAIADLFVVEGAADILATLEIAGFFYLENKPALMGMTKSYQIILQAEAGGGPELDKFYKMLGTNNPKWTEKDGMTKEVFRQIIVDMDKRDELCTNVSGYTLGELKNLFGTMSDSEVTFFQSEAPNDLKHLAEQEKH